MDEFKVQRRKTMGKITTKTNWLELIPYLVALVIMILIIVKS